MYICSCGNICVTVKQMLEKWINVHMQHNLQNDDLHPRKLILLKHFPKIVNLRSCYFISVKLNSYESVLYLTCPVGALSMKDVSALKLAVSKHICSTPPSSGNYRCVMY